MTSPHPAPASADRNTPMDAPAEAATANPARRVPWIAMVAFALLVAFPYVASYSLVGVGFKTAVYTIIAASLVLLVGWVGQISLAHAALVGVGGYATGWATAAWGLNFPFSLLVAGLIAAAVAAVLGSVALRVRGLYLAVATLIFSWMADAFLFRLPVVVQHASIDVPVIGDPDGVPRFDLGDRTTMYFVAWGIALAVCFLAAGLRDSKTGRAFFALRGSEIGAASLGVDVTRYKLLAFTVSGFLAGIAGSLLMLEAQTLSPEDFAFTRSLFFLSIAVVGGLTSLGGGIASALFFAGLDEVFFRVPSLGNKLDLVSAMLLAVMLLAYRGGLAAVPASLAKVGARAKVAIDRRGPEWLQWFVDWFPKELDREWQQLTDIVGGVSRTARHRIPRVELPWPRRGAGTTPVTDAPDTTVTDDAAVGAALAIGRGGQPVIVDASGITVRFGGLTAVSEASLQVCKGEIVGLIGPNGAGKTTLFNAIAGLNRPTEGTVRLLGTDVTTEPVHLRAALGVARTFQAIQLFPQLDVFENLLVATHVHNRSGFLRHAVGADGSLAAEVEAQGRVWDVIDELGLEDVAHRRVGDLPFGMLRVIELGRALVTGFPFVMLDEPASGLDNTETQRFAQLLRDIRDRGRTLLLIEHDVQLVTSLCDYIYVLNRGELIAEGTPAEIQADAGVRAAYLGEPEGATGEAA